jgi:BlaI family penicillinase repressor
MARPADKHLTPRELEVMQVFWTAGPLTAGGARKHLAAHRELVQVWTTDKPPTVEEVRERLAARRKLAYATVANLVRILHTKGFLRQTNSERPFLYAPARSQDDVARGFLHDMVERVFGASREQVLVKLLEDQPLTESECVLLQGVLAKESKRLSGIPEGASACSATLEA